MDRCYYHYTSLEAFKTIISNKSLRLCDLRKTNDYLERKWIINILEKSLINSFEENGITINLKEDYWYDEESHTHLEYLVDMLKYFVEHSSFITCFSKNGDLLSQWRAYGDNGNGISIGFDSRLISKSIKKNKVYFEYVLYKSEDQVQEIKFAVVNAINYMKEMFKDDLFKIHSDFNEYFVEEFDVFCEVICDDLANISCYMKNPSFIEEDEVRIIYSPSITIESDDLEIKEVFTKELKFNNFVLNPLNYFTRDDQLIGYVDLFFEKLINRNIITEIIIGPSSRVTEEDIFLLLSQYGYNVRDVIIRSSESSYRLK